jgi:hypothetical protein
LEPGFTTQRVDALKPSIKEHVTKLIDGMKLQRWNSAFCPRCRSLLKPGFNNQHMKPSIKANTMSTKNYIRLINA